jgi:hypothetical protein
VEISDLSNPLEYESLILQCDDRIRLITLESIMITGMVVLIFLIVTWHIGQLRKY